MRPLRVWMGGLLAGACTGCSAILGIGDPTVQAADDGGSMAAPPASGGLGAICSVPEDCMSAECVTLKMNNQNLSGLCTSDCTSSADCGPRGTCVPQAAVQQSICLLECSTTADCAHGAVCTWNSLSSTGVCGAIPIAICSSVSGQPGCGACIGLSCCSELQACLADLECSMLESQCSSGVCASALQGSANKAASALYTCAASQCSNEC
jgi:hypothetical protein